MEYIQLDSQGNNPQQVPPMTNIIWDDSHFCNVERLTPDELTMFRVHQVIEVIPPASTPEEIVERDGVEFVEDQWKQKWSIRAVTLSEINAKIIASVLQINRDDNKIYADVIGNKTTEYLDAAADAKAYKLAGYPSEPVPSSIKSWADAKIWTNQQAADDIISQEIAWKTAAAAIRQYRLKAKEDVKRATTMAGITTAMAIWSAFVTSIRSQLGVSQL